MSLARCAISTADLACLLIPSCGLVEGATSPEGAGWPASPEAGRGLCGALGSPDAAEFEVTMPVIRIRTDAEDELVERFDRRVRQIEEKIAKARAELRGVRRDARACGIDMLAFDFRRRLTKLGAEREAAFRRAFDIYTVQLSLKL